MSSTKDLIHSTEFVREPVEKEINYILRPSCGKIIYTGGRGIGKSVVLCSLENVGLFINQKTIYIHPEAMETRVKEPDERFDKKFFDYKEELYFTNQILLYIKYNYPIVFERCFKDKYEKVRNLLAKFEEQFLASAIEDNIIECKYGTLELSDDILNLMRQEMNIEYLNLAIDGFDRINGSSEYVQKIYERYFDMFDKVILTSDDLNIDKDRLSSKGYDIRNLSYSSNKKVLKEIIRSRYKEDSFLINFFCSSTALDKLINYTNNIDEIFMILVEVKERYEFHNHHVKIDNILDDVFGILNVEKQKRKQYLKKPTLYL